jgi:hypothetical protein
MKDGEMCMKVECNNEIVDKVRDLIVGFEIRKDEERIEMDRNNNDSLRMWKEKRKNEMLLVKYGKVINEVRKNLRIVEELGVVKGNGWEFWKNEVSGGREIEIVSFGNKVKEVVEGYKVIVERKNVCENCGLSVCRLDWVMDEKMVKKSGRGFVGKMLVGNCGLKWNCELKNDEFGVDVVEGVLEGVWSEVIDGDRMERKVESDLRYENFVKDWNNGVFLRKWKVNKMRELDEKVKNKGRLIVERLNRMLNEKKVVDGVVIE